MLKENIFKLDLRKFLVLWLPTPLRKPVLVHLLWCALLPLWTAFQVFYRKRLENVFYARYDSGKGNIERMLNILFDSQLRGIKIESGGNAIKRRPIYLFEKLKEGAAVVSSSSLVNDSYIEREQVQVAFCILVPRRLKNQVDNIRSKANLYVLPGMGFTIELTD